MTNKPAIIFFGTDQDVSVTVLKSLSNSGYHPDLIVTQPDRPQGRKLQLTPCPVKIWADENGVQTFQPEKLNKDAVTELCKKDWDFFIVASYGLIIPETVLNIPKYGTLNVHPSLLPKYRGATPLESAILDDAKETGVTIIKMDEKMDHGPILDQETYTFAEWPDKPVVAKTLAEIGGKLIIQSIEDILGGTSVLIEQNHAMATFTKKINKTDGEIDLNDDARKNFLKSKAYNPWPGTFFFKNEKRIKITETDWKDEKFVIKKVIPEGKKEMSFEVFNKN